MIIKKKQKTTVETVKTIICDLCGWSYRVDIGWDDMEVQEFVSVHRKGGYGSVFGDEEEINVDICQYCFKKNILDKIRKKDDFKK